MSTEKLDVYRYRDIQLGTWADTVLEIMLDLNQIMTTNVLGMDNDGFVVEWKYPDVVFTMKRAKTKDPIIGELEVYAVQKIELLNTANTECMFAPVTMETVGEIHCFECGKCVRCGWSREVILADKNLTPWLTEEK